MSRHPKSLQLSYSGGEISVDMFARIDDARYRNAVAKMQNCRPTPQGGADRRRGLRYVSDSKDGLTATKLLPFVGGENRSAVLQVGIAEVDGRDIGYARVLIDGAPLLYEQPPVYIAPANINSFSSPSLWNTGLAHGLTTGDPIVITMYPDGGAPTVSFASVATTSPQTFTCSSSNLGADKQQVVFRNDGGTLPSNIVEGRVYWILSKSSSTYTFSETYQGPPVLGAASASTGTIRLAAMTRGANDADGHRVNHVYYAVVTSTTQFRIAESRADALANSWLSITANGEGSRRVHYAYRSGDLVEWTGPGEGNFRCLREPWGFSDAPDDREWAYLNDHTGHAPTSLGHWVRIPGTILSATASTVTNRITAAAHGLLNGQPFVLAGSTAPSGLVIGEVYYARDVDTNTFRVSTVPGGSAITLASTGSGVRVLIGGIYEIPLRYTLEDDLAYAQSNDVMTITSNLHPVTEIRRTRVGRFDVRQVKFEADVGKPSKPFEVDVNPGEGVGIISTSSTPNTLTSLKAHNFTPGNPVYVTGLSSVGISDGEYIIDTVPSSTQVTLKTVESGATVNVTASVTSLTIPRIRYNAPGSDIEGEYCITAVNENDEESEPSDSIVITNNLNVAGSSTTIGWSTTRNAARFRIYKKENGLFGRIGETEDLQFKDDNIAPDLGLAPPRLDRSMRRSSVVTIDVGTDTITWAGHGMSRYSPVQFETNGELGTIEEGRTYFVLPTSDDTFQISDSDQSDDVFNITGTVTGEHFAVAGNFPAAVAYFEGRRVFGGPRVEPRRFLATASGTEADMGYSIPTTASDRLSFALASHQNCEIRHLVPVGQLVALTNSSELRITPTDDSVLTPFSFSARPQTYVGSSVAHPIVINNTVVFVGARGGHLRELSFSREVQGYLTGDLSLRASHLFDGLSIVQLACQQAPVPTIWAVSSNGKLLGLTYLPEENISGWHQHVLGGLADAEAVAVIPEGDNDAVYVAVATPEGRQVWRMSDDTGSCYVDGGVSYEGAASLTVFAPNLAGESVIYSADGVDGEGTVSSDGTLTLPVAAATVHVGKSYVSELRTLPLAAQIDSAGGIGRLKNIGQVWLRVVGGGEVTVESTELGPSLGQLVDTITPTQVGTVWPLRIPGTWEYDAQVTISKSDSLPLKILGHVIEFAVGG